MFCFLFDISHPRSRMINFQNLLLWSKKITKNKAIEIEFSHDPSKIFGIMVEQTFCEDHAGFTFAFGMLFISFEFKFYDVRHWNSKREHWIETGEIDD